LDNIKCFSPCNINITRNLTNTNVKHRQNFSISRLQWIFLIEYALVVSIGKHWQTYFLSIYWGNYSAKRNNEKKIKKYDGVSVLQIELQTNLNPLVNLSIIFNLLPDEWPFSLPPSFLHLSLFFFTTNGTPLILS
jgi:hypothetical protein